MKVYDSLITEINQRMGAFQKQHYHSCTPWKSLDEHHMILRKNAAYELDGTGFNLLTSEVVLDEIVVIGPELNQIRYDQKFTRIAIVQIEVDKTEQKAYTLIKKIDYVKYHLFPDGMMMRSTSRSHKESIRVSKKAIEKGITFQNLGSLMICKMKEIAKVKGVKMIFITDPKADYEIFETMAEKQHMITETLNHVMNSVKFDCNTCNLKAICDEVEELRELHFRR
ncbi:MAG: hypothetical protein IJ356_04285 [Erysipelotrichaceae bacterium]|nr:hypothetical protein [Erysipelotrichaceae bacterium]